MINKEKFMYLLEQIFDDKHITPEGKYIKLYVWNFRLRGFLFEEIELILEKLITDYKVISDYTIADRDHRKKYGSNSFYSVKINDDFDRFYFNFKKVLRIKIKNQWSLSTIITERN